MTTEDSPDYEPTNTLLLLGLDRAACKMWKTKLSGTAGVDEVVSLPSFARVLVICKDTTCAASLSQKCMEEDSALQVVYGPTMDPHEQVSRLEVPTAERLLFISPPCSPPAGWMITQEEPPNTRTHFEEELNARLVAMQAERHLMPLEMAPQASPDLSGKPSLHVDVPHTTVLVEGSETTPTISLDIAFGSPEISPLRELPRTSLPRDS